MQYTPMSRSTPPRDIVLEISGVTKCYGDATVLDGIDLAFAAGEVHALLGENGAGKSTLVKIVAGVIGADAGTVSGSAYDAGDIAMVFQELSVVPEMSVLDNLALASRSTGWRVPYRALRPRASHVLEAAGLSDIDLDTPVATLSLAQRQLLEIARGLIVDARVLILDEPTATLSDIEIERVHRVVLQLVASGHTVVYITHRLAEVFSLSDRTTIMRAGRIAATGPTSDFTMGEVVGHMLGADHEVIPRTAARQSGEVPDAGLRVRDLTCRGRFREVSFEARRGSLLALFGQIGSGADDVARALAGLAGVSQGEVSLDSTPVRLGSRHGTQREGISYVSADRVAEGVFLDAPVCTNVSSGALNRVSAGGIVRRAREHDLARQLAADVSLDPGRITEPVSAFSGGNQQKVAVARALATRPRVLVLNEPTRGVDIGARSEIYRSIRTLLHDGLIVIAYTSDIVEIREFADHVMTMYRGDVVGDHVVDDITDAALIREILGGDAA